MTVDSDLLTGHLFSSGPMFPAPPHHPKMTRTKFEAIWGTTVNLGETNGKSVPRVSKGV